MRPAKIPVVYILLFKLQVVWIRIRGSDIMQKRLSFFKLSFSLLNFLKQETIAVGARCIHYDHLKASGNKGRKPAMQKGKQPLEREWLAAVCWVRNGKVGTQSQHVYSCTWGISDLTVLLLSLKNVMQVSSVIAIMMIFICFNTLGGKVKLKANNLFCFENSNF